jgi:hypothetical protein
LVDRKSAGCFTEGRLRRIQVNEINDPIRSEDSPKRAWSAPVIEDLAVNATEAAYIPGAPADLGIYTV